MLLKKQLIFRNGLKSKTLQIKLVAIQQTSKI
jgi:hypothetical protein